MPHHPNQSDPDSLDAAFGGRPPAGDGDRIRGVVEAALFGGEPPPPQRIGKYRVDDCVGAGAMGEVFAAYDDVLDRKVALKLVRPQQASPTATARLIQEAKSLARLDHPNVVRVHEAGFVGERGWIAMQFVEGRTLRAWLEESPRSTEEVLVALCAAGRGLAAAHDAGLVHRDFKPDNVLVAYDDVVRVADFGLVRFFADTDPEPSTWPVESIPEGVRGLLEGRLTEDGTVMGTPAYMPPEQLLGGRVDALSDQFAFCVTCCEALFGVRPFTGRTRRELFDAIAAQQFGDGAETGRVPKRIERALRRGLRVRPEERFESMDALLAELGRTPRSRVPWILAASAVVLAGGAWQLGLGPFDDKDPCVDGPRIGSVWPDSSAARVEDAFERQDLAFAGRMLAKVNERLDGYAESWSGVHATACRPQETIEVRRQILGCLELQRSRVGMIVHEFERADRLVVSNALDSLAVLPVPEDCLPAEQHLQYTASPSSPLVEDLVRADLLAKKGSSESAEAMAGTIINLARARADVRVEIDALRIRARARLDLGYHHKAVDDLNTARNLALEHRRDSRYAEVSIELTIVAATILRDAKRAYEWGGEAESAISRLGLDPSHGRWALARAYKLQLVQDYEGARAAFDEIVQGPHDPDSELVREAKSSRAAVSYWENDIPRAITEYRKILQDRHRRYTREHPATATAAYNLGTALDRAGSDEAERYYRWGLEVWSSLYPDGNTDVAGARIALGNIALKSADVATAREHAEAALEISMKLLDRDDTKLGEAWTLMGVVEHVEGNYEQAAASHGKARDIYERQIGPENTFVAISMSNRAEAVLHAGSFEEAQRGFEEARRILTKIHGAKHAYVAYPLKGLGLLAVADGRDEDATALLRRAQEQLGAQDPIESLEIDAALAWAMRSTDRPKSRALLARIRDSARSLGPSAAHRVDALEPLMESMSSL